MKNQKYSQNKFKKDLIYDIFITNPYDLFDKSKIFNLLKESDININSISSILLKFFKNGKLMRTKIQLSNGYIYSLKNKEQLEKLYIHYLLPYDFTNYKLIKLIVKDKFDILRNKDLINIEELYSYSFLSKYDLHYLIDKNILVFLSKLVAFIMGDGHLTKVKQNIYFYFRHLEDANKFKEDFLSIFYKEKVKIKKAIYCYEFQMSSKSFANLLERLGAPIGNKVIKPFLVPNWIYHGPNDIKLAFLSTIYGNEGSKPQDNKWRIQFVISKNKENIKNLLIFLNQIKHMLDYFGFTSSYIQLRKQEGRQFCGRYYIKGRSNLHKFYKLLEFSYASEKQQVLENLILRGNSSLE